MEIVKPIIIVGTGRNGSSVYYDLFAKHPQVMWTSILLARFPNYPWLNQKGVKAVNLPVVGPYLTRRITTNEPYQYWERFFPGFGRPYRDLLASDVTLHTQKRLRSAMSALLRPERRRLVLKITGWPRVGFLHKIFPDAVFIHLIRDGRAVASSCFIPISGLAGKGLRIGAMGC